MIDAHDDDALWGCGNLAAGTAGTSGSDRPRDFQGLWAPASPTFGFDATPRGRPQPGRSTVPPPDITCGTLMSWLTPPPDAPRRRLRSSDRGAGVVAGAPGPVELARQPERSRQDLGYRHDSCRNTL